MNILTPSLFGNSVFTSCYGGKSLLFNLDKKSTGFEISQKWENKQEAYMSSPIVIGDYCYLHLRKQRMTCLDMRTGETKWISSESFGKYMSLVSNGEEIIALDEDGTLYRIDANPEKLVILEEREISKSPTWSYPAFPVGRCLSGNLKRSYAIAGKPFLCHCEEDASPTRQSIVSRGTRTTCLLAHWLTVDRHGLRPHDDNNWRKETVRAYFSLFTLQSSLF